MEMSPGTNWVSSTVTVDATEEKNLPHLSAIETRSIDLTRLIYKH